jgi:hypothetical protein
VTGNIRALILNMEAAQVQGLGDALVRLQMNDPAISGVHETLGAIHHQAMHCPF